MLAPAYCNREIASVARMSEATSGSHPQAWTDHVTRLDGLCECQGDAARRCSGVRHGLAASGLLPRISLRSSGLLAHILPCPRLMAWRITGAVTWSEIWMFHIS